MSIYVVLENDLRVQEMTSEVNLNRDFYFDAHSIINSENWPEIENSLRSSVSNLELGVFALNLTVPDLLGEVVNVKNESLTYSDGLKNTLVNDLKNKVENINKNKNDINYSGFDYRLIPIYVSYLRSLYPNEVDQIISENLNDEIIEKIINIEYSDLDNDTKMFKFLGNSFYIKMAFPDKKLNFENIEKNKKDEIFNKLFNNLKNYENLDKFELIGYLVYSSRLKALFPEYNFTIPTNKINEIYDYVNRIKNQYGTDSYYDSLIALTLLSSESIDFTDEGLKLNNPKNKPIKKNLEEMPLRINF